MKGAPTELPKWAKVHSNVKRVVVIDGPTWDGEKFSSPLETIQELKKLKCEILIPVILTAERQVFLLHLDMTDDIFKVTSFVAT